MLLSMTLSFIEIREKRETRQSDMDQGSLLKFSALHLYIPKSLEDLISTEITAASLFCIFTGGWMLCLSLKNVYVIGREPFSERQDKVTFWPFFA